VRIFPPKSVDTVFLADVIEHLEKEEGARLLRTTAGSPEAGGGVHTAGLSAPVREGRTHGGWMAPWQEHKSGWLLRISTTIGKCTLSCVYTVDHRRPFRPLTARSGRYGHRPKSRRAGRKRWTGGERSGRVHDLSVEEYPGRPGRLPVGDAGCPPGRSNRWGRRLIDFLVAKKRISGNRLQKVGIVSTSFHPPLGAGGRPLPAAGGDASERYFLISRENYEGEGSASASEAARAVLPACAPIRIPCHGGPSSLRLVGIPERENRDPKPGATNRGDRPQGGLWRPDRVHRRPVRPACRRPCRPADRVARDPLHVRRLHPPMDGAIEENRSTPGAGDFPGGACRDRAERTCGGGVCETIWSRGPSSGTRVPSRTRHWTGGAGLRNGSVPHRLHGRRVPCPGDAFET
jgi:hypothetical protein